MKKLNFCSQLTLLVLVGSLPITTYANPPLAIRPISLNRDMTYPPVGSYALLPWLTSADAEKLGQYCQFMVVSAENDINRPELLADIKRRNPKAMMIPYVSQQQFPLDSMNYNEKPGGPVHRLHDRITDEMWLYTTTGKKISLWSGCYVMNMTDGVNAGNWPWVDMLVAEVVSRRYGSNSNWDDIIFFDDTWIDFSWVPAYIKATQGKEIQIDANRDGQPDAPTWLDDAWLTGAIRAFSRTRQVKPEAVIVSQNGTTTRLPIFHKLLAYVNGWVFEDAQLDPASVRNMITRFQAISRLAQRPNYSLLNVRGSQNDNARQESGLALACIFDLYYYYDRDHAAHDTLWIYRNYQLDLGHPTSSALEISPNVWRRTFKKGTAFFNASDSPTTATCDRAKTWSSAAISSTDITLKPGTGCILYNYDTARLRSKP